MGAFKHRKVMLHTLGRESWVMTQRILSEVQEEEVGFLQSSWLTIVAKCTVTKFINPECADTFPPIKKISAAMIQARDRNVPAYIGESNPTGYTLGKAAQISTKEQIG